MISKLINSVLNKLGYVKLSQALNTLSDEQICALYVTKIGDPSEYGLDAKSTKAMCEDLAATEYYPEFLKATSAKDIQRYFAAENDEQRFTVRGALSRTIYLRGLITKRAESKDTKVAGERYAK